MALRKNAKIELIKGVPLFSRCNKKELAAVAPRFRPLKQRTHNPEIAGSKPARPISKPESEGTPEHADFDARTHPPSKARGTPEALDPARVRQQCAFDGAESREHVTATQQEDPHRRALDHIAPIRNDDFERASPNSERSKVEAMDDSARNPDEDDDPDSHPNSHARAAPRLRREQHERGVITWKRTGRH